ncbi:MAG: hypothetical protein Q9226_001635 [Calogaya cf. arnoldii]
MLLTWLSSWLIVAPLVIQALSIIKPRVDDNTQDNEICLAYDTCSEKGYGYWNKLHTTLYQSQQGQIVDRNDSALFQSHYFTRYYDSEPLERELHQPLRDRDVDPTMPMDTWLSFGLNPMTQKRDKQPAYYNIFDTHNGFIIADNNNHKGDSQKALPWSELMYQTWKHAAQKANQLTGSDHPPGGPISNLRGVVQHFIINKGTQQVLMAAYRAKGWEPGYDGEYQWRKFTEEDAGSKNYFFYALLGTDNVKGTVWLLNDHANEIGRKEISAIYTNWHMGNPDIWYVTESA